MNEEYDKFHPGFLKIVKLRQTQNRNARSEYIRQYQEREAKYATTTERENPPTSAQSTSGLRE